MNYQPQSLWQVNPFSTRFVRPGALPYMFRCDHDTAGLLDKLERQRWMGQIVGPHGSGKSTLLCTVIEALESQGRRVVGHTLSSSAVYSEHLLPKDAECDTQVVVDGFEQLSRRRQRALIRRAKSRGCGLLATTHDDNLLPTLYVARPDRQRALALVRELLGNSKLTIEQSDVERLYRQHAPDMREMLFALYDLVEQLRQM